MDPRTRMLLEAPIGRTLLQLVAPNIVVMLAQACVRIIETYFVGKPFENSSASTRTVLLTSQ